MTLDQEVGTTRKNDIENTKKLLALFDIMAFAYNIEIYKRSMVTFTS